MTRVRQALAKKIKLAKSEKFSLLEPVLSHHSKPLSIAKRLAMGKSLRHAVSFLDQGTYIPPKKSHRPNRNTQGAS